MKGTIFAVLFVVLHNSQCIESLNIEEAIFNSFDVLRLIVSPLIKEDFPLTNYEDLQTTVRPICPLLDRHFEIKEYILSGKAANITEMKAAEVILEHVLNDTCNWIQSLINVTDFVCSSNNLIGLQMLCIETMIKSIAVNQRRELLSIYSGEKYVKRFNHLPGNRNWIMETFRGKDASVIDDTLHIIKKFGGYTKCQRIEETISCSK